MYALNEERRNGENPENGAEVMINGLPNKSISRPYRADEAFTMLTLGAWQGKSTILYHCIADAAERNATCIYFDFTGNNELPLHIQEKAHIISIFFEDQGYKIKETIASIASNGIGEVIIVDLNLGSGRINNDWFAVFMIRLTDSIPAEFISRLGYVLADEFERIGLVSEEIRKAFSILLDTANANRPQLEGAKVVLATQDIRINHFSSPFSIICDSGGLKELATLLDCNFIFDSNCITQVYLVDQSEPYESTQLDLGDRAFFLRNISKFAVSRLMDKRNSTALTDSLFVKNDKFRYFENAERQLLSSKPRG